MKKNSEHKYCPNMQAPILFSDDTQKGRRLIIKARCKLWSCPYCSKVNAHQHWIRILNGVNQLRNKGQNFSFVTITSHEKLKTAEQCLRVWRNAWRKLRARLQRIHDATYGYRMAFVVVTELHKDGRLHWHMLVNNEFNTRWYKNNARACGLGYQCKSVKLDNAVQASNYVAKYLTKATTQSEFPQKMRRIVYSQNFPEKPHFDSDLQWQILDAKRSIVDCIREGWRLDLDTYLNGDEILEILEE